MRSGRLDRSKIGQRTKNPQRTFFLDAAREQFPTFRFLLRQPTLNIYCGNTHIFGRNPQNGNFTCIMRWPAPVRKRHAESWRMDQNGSTKVPTSSKTPTASIPNLFGAVRCAWGVCAARFHQDPLGPPNPAKVENPQIRDLGRKCCQIRVMDSGFQKCTFRPRKVPPWGFQTRTLNR